MKVLIIKTSSMGDVVHTLPALSDAGNYIKDIRFDWVVEEGFAEIPRWHRSIENVIPVAWRRWRKQLLQTIQQKQLQTFKQHLRAQKYDLIIDAQGLFKSAIIAYFARGIRCGLGFSSAREGLAAVCYQRRYTVDKQLHAVTRVRQLFANALNYPVPHDMPDYGIDTGRFMQNQTVGKYVVFIHGTTWKTKLWPVNYWIAIAQKLAERGYEVKLPWGNNEEQQRAHYITSHCSNAKILPKSSLNMLADVLLHAQAVLAVDTGLGHLAAALSVPTLSLYGPTDPTLIGTYGNQQIHLQATGKSGRGNLADLNSDYVWEKLQTQLI